MPLAIILAMSWLRMLTLREIGDELSQSIDILENQMRDLPARQRSIRATILSSWHRLTAEEQQIFTNLSVFRGGFTREPAQHITGAGLKELQSLIDRSFITFNHGRYEIHELLRQFASEKLRETGHADEVYAAHSAFYLNWLHGLSTAIKGRSQINALTEIGANLDNLRLAWEWAVRRGQDADVDMAVETLYMFFFISNRGQEGVELLQFALEGRDTRRENPALETRIRIRLYSLMLLEEKPVVTRADLEACVSAARAHLDAFETAFALEVLAVYLTHVTHEYEASIHLLEESLELLKDSDDTFRIAAVYYRLGYSHLQVTGIRTQARFMKQAYKLAKRTGNLCNLSVSLSGLGTAALYLGNYREAEQYYRESLPVIDALGFDTNRFEIITLAHILFLVGKIEEGRRFLDIALHQTSASMEGEGVSFGYAIASLFEVIDGEYERALEYASRSLSETPENIICIITANLGAAMACCGLNDIPAAERYLLQALHQSQRLDFYASATWGFPALVICRARLSQVREAVEYLALLHTHPLSAKDWLAAWPLLANTEVELKRHMDKPAYDAAWERGTKLRLETVIAQLVSGTHV